MPRVSGSTTKFISGSAIAIAASLVGSPSYARSVQDAAPVAAGQEQGGNAQNPSAEASPADVQSGDIVVTARRRTERLQDVPLSVTAASGRQLTERQITTAMDLGKLAPSLTVTPSSRGSNTPYFVIRGQRLIDVSAVLDPVTIVYVNEVPFMRPQGLNGALFDVQNVQVLRGPQGTLFGRSTTGGAVLVNTNAPSDRFGGYANVTVGSYNWRAAEGALNVPISDTLAVRVAGTLSRRDGYMTDRYTGYRANGEHYDAQRVTIQWKPNADFTSTIYANRFDSANNGSASQIYAVEPTNTTNPSIDRLRQEVALNLAQPYFFGSDLAQVEKTRTWDVTNVTTFKASPHITLKNVIGYRKISTFSSFDLDASPISTQQVYGTTSIKQFSEEFQIQGTGKSFDWILGGFYFREHGSDVPYSIIGGNTAVLSYTGTFPVNTSISAFASGTYRFPIEGLSLSAGIRYSHDKREADSYQARVNAANGQIIACTFRDSTGALIAPPCLFSQEASFGEPSWSVSLNYKPDRDLLFYIAHRRGYRSGGVQSRPATQGAAVPFAPEKVNDIEVGAKYAFRSGDLTGSVNVDAYYAWYKGLQRQVSFISPTSQVLISGIFNAAAATVKGFEGELNLKFKGIELNGSVGYVKGTYQKYENGGVDISSWPFSYVPSWTANGELAYSPPIDPALGQLRASVSVRYQSQITASDIPQPNARLPGWAIADARLDWRNISGSPLSVAAFATNIFNKVYHPYATNLSNSLGVANWHVGAPRMIGGQVRIDF